jgi:tripartite-type tricarboxylate transporter receptor subunit TctC
VFGRRIISCTLLQALVVVSLAALADAQAENFPAKPIRIVVPYPPGGSGDIIGTAVGEKMTEAWGQRLNRQSGRC